MGRSNPWGDLDQMSLVGRYGGRNHVCNIWWLSVKGCGCGERGKFAFSHWLHASPLQHWSHYRVTVWFHIDYTFILKFLIFVILKLHISRFLTSSASSLSCIIRSFCCSKYRKQQSWKYMLQTLIPDSNFQERKRQCGLHTVNVTFFDKIIHRQRCLHSNGSSPVHTGDKVDRIGNSRLCCRIIAL